MSLNLGTMYVKFDAQTASFHKKAQEFGTTLTGIGSSAKKAGTAISLGVTAPAVAAAGLGVASFTKFEGAMRNVNTIAKLSDREFQATTEAVKDMAVELGKQPTGLAESLYDVYSSGFAGAEAMDLLRTNTVAASAGLATAKEAGQGIMAVLNAYGLSASEAGDVSDIFFKTVERGVTTFPELAGGVGNVISTAATLKVPFDQVAAALATMTKGGISTRESVTALNAMFMRIISGSEELDAAFKAETGTTASLLLQSKGLGAVMQVLDKVTGGSADKFKELGFETRDFKAAASLARQGGAAFAEDLANIANKSARAGAAQAAYNEQTRSLAFAIDQTKSKLAVIGIELGERLAPAFRMLNTLLQRGILWWRGLGDGTKDIAVALIATVAAAGPVLLVFGKLASIFGSMSPLITGVLVQGMGIIRWFTKIGSFTGVIATLWTTLVGAVSAIASFALPVLAVAAAIGGLAYVLIQASGEGDTFREKMASLWDKFAGWTAGAWAAVRVFVTNTIGFFQNFGENMDLLLGWLGRNWGNMLRDMVQIAVVYSINMIQNWINVANKYAAVWGVMVGWLVDHWRTLPGKLIGIWAENQVKMITVAWNLGKMMWDGLKAGLTNAPLDTEGLKLGEEFTQGFMTSGNLVDRLKSINWKEGWKKPLEGFKSSVEALPEFNLGAKVEAPAEAAAEAVKEATEATSKLGDESVKTGQAMEAMWKGAGAATKGSADAQKALTRHMQLSQAGNLGTATRSAFEVKRPVPATEANRATDAQAVSEDKTYRTASLQELAAIRTALQAMEAVLVSEAGAAAV